MAVDDRSEISYSFLARLCHGNKIFLGFIAWLSLDAAFKIKNLRYSLLDEHVFY